ncbi:putative AlkP superfamily pyrophosphatase or phosphodiesterase [Catalinimonas alkaloidigena]|uniref:alkaline phosphatase family protein n=1 Tax=Catalinimonas alkaloidigena TaxID=1075417 RepID=UPI00240557A4|nr:alkaline phosphatase family protein [Catalinimonas alkaloidigena]MDF9798437.1 putative AlkP superfamily pyrophosphatase or phosphodiesterase [Catalinimonas alkaloidigena]
MRNLVTCSLLFLSLASDIHAQMLPGIKHVVLIGIDGLSPEGILQATTPTFDSLMQEGAYSMTAQAVLPSSSGPNWASMIYGASPEEHAVYNNEWRPKDIGDQVLCNEDSGSMWPSIFRLVREEYQEADLASFHDWPTIGRLIEPGVLNMLADTKGEDRTAEAAASYLFEHEPSLMFVHLDHVDHAGHSQQWGSAEYLHAVEKADHLTNLILDGLRKKGLLEESLIILTSDHGGINTSHGGNTPEETTIPWIISGANVKGSYEIPDDIMTYDTAATIAYVFGIQQPSCWIGRPVISAFTEY